VGCVRGPSTLEAVAVVSWEPQQSTCTRPPVHMRPSLPSCKSGREAQHSLHGVTVWQVPVYSVYSACSEQTCVWWSVPTVSKNGEGASCGESSLCERERRG